MLMELHSAGARGDLDLHWGGTGSSTGRWRERSGLHWEALGDRPALGPTLGEALGPGTGSGTEGLGPALGAKLLQWGFPFHH
jgi:hypothetical protein